MSEINPKLQELVTTVLINFFDNVNESDSSEFYRLRNNVVKLLEMNKKHYEYMDTASCAYLDETIDYLFTLHSLPEKKNTIPDYLIFFSSVAFLCLLFVFLSHDIINNNQAIIILICYLIGKELGLFLKKEN